MTDTLTLDAQIEQLRAHRDRLASGQVRAHDPRLAAFWERAGDKASDEGMCGVYDDIVDEVGGVGREHDWAVPVTLSISLSATLATTARDAEIARERFDDEDWDDLLERVADSLGISRDLLGHAHVESVDIDDPERTD